MGITWASKVKNDVTAPCEICSVDVEYFGLHAESKFGVNKVYGMALG